MMDALGKVNWGSVAEWVQVVMTILATWLALRQWKHSCAVSRAEHLREMLDDFNFEIVADGFRELIDRVPEDGVPVKFYTGDIGGPCFEKKYERTVDTMLLTFSWICSELMSGVISRDEFKYFEYQIKRTLQNDQIVAYLKDLADFTKNQRVQFPFGPLVQVGARLMQSEYQQLALDLNLRVARKVKD